MKKILIATLVVTALFTFNSCATIFTGSKKKVTFDGNVKENVTLTVDGYKYRNVTFPYTIKIKGGFEDTYVKAECEGYKPTQVVIGKSFNAVSIINLFDIVGWGIDAATGALMKPEFKFYEFEFNK